MGLATMKLKKSKCMKRLERFMIYLNNIILIKRGSFLSRFYVCVVRKPQKICEKSAGN